MINFFSRLRSFSLKFSYGSKQKIVTQMIMICKNPVTKVKTKHFEFASSKPISKTEVIKMENVELVETPNYDGFIVIGAGLPRTGTSSLRKALSYVLNGPVHHMRNVLEGSKEENEFWNKAMDGKVGSKDWQDFFEGRGFRGGVDYPTSAFYKDIMKAYPDAKIILSVRDPKKWYHSVKNSIYQHAIFDGFPVNVFLKITGKSATASIIGNICRSPHNKMDLGMFQAIDKGLEIAEEFYNEWVEAVKNTVPSEKLLVFEVKDGWKPLCEFLDVPVPNAPFPWDNDTASIQKQCKKIRILSHIFVIGIPLFVIFVIVAVLSWYFG